MHVRPQSFLVFERGTGRFLEFFCGSKSTRSEAKKLYPFLPLTTADIARQQAAGNDVDGLEPHGPLPLTLKSRLVEKGTYSWHVPVVVKCWQSLHQDADNASGSTRRSRPSSSARAMASRS